MTKTCTVSINRRVSLWMICEVWTCTQCSGWRPAQLCGDLLHCTGWMSICTWASWRLEDFGQGGWMSTRKCRYSEGVRGGTCLRDAAGSTGGLDIGSGEGRGRRVKGGVWQGAVLERNIRCNEGTAHLLWFRMSWEKWWWSWRGTDKNRGS